MTTRSVAEHVKEIKCGGRNDPERRTKVSARLKQSWRGSKSNAPWSRGQWNNLPVSSSWLLTPTLSVAAPTCR